MDSADRFCTHTIHSAREAAERFERALFRLSFIFICAILVAFLANKACATDPAKTLEDFKVLHERSTKAIERFGFECGRLVGYRMAYADLRPETKFPALPKPCAELSARAEKWGNP